MSIDLYCHFHGLTLTNVVAYSGLVYIYPFKICISLSKKVPFFMSEILMKI